MTSMYSVPLRHIFNAVDAEKWQASDTCEDFVKFIGAVNTAVRDKPNSCACIVNETLTRLIAVLEELGVWADEIQPIAQPMRYGNKAFRLWHERLVQQAARLCRSVLPADKAGADIELEAYLLDSFGNATRIDYGTGHETTFMMLVYCLAKLGLVAPADLVAVGTKVFPLYLTIARKLQRKYGLEPAGSHGVWSLDDYQFLAFLFGSSQLAGHAHIRPRSVHSADVLEGFAKEYTYLSSIQFVTEVKQGAPFAEHSPILNDISTLPSWAKANDGLQKMYRAEVLGKLPVVQHFPFGSLMPATWTASRVPVLSETMAHALAATARDPATAALAQAAERLSSAESVPIDEPARAAAPWVTSPPPVAGAGTPADAAEADRASVAAEHRVAVAAGVPAATPPGDGVVAFMEAFGTGPKPARGE